MYDVQNPQLVSSWCLAFTIGLITSSLILCQGHFHYVFEVLTRFASLNGQLEMSAFYWKAKLSESTELFIAISFYDLMLQLPVSIMGLGRLQRRKMALAV